MWGQRVARDVPDFVLRLAMIVAEHPTAAGEVSRLRGTDTGGCVTGVDDDADVAIRATDAGRL